MQIVDGQELWSPDPSDPILSNNWVGITYEGELVSGDAADYESTYKGKLRYGVCCGRYIMTDGRVNLQDRGSYSRYATCHTAIAFTADGGFVLVCIDGLPELRNGVSAGGTTFDIITILWDLDLEYTDAYIFDGGGSTEMVVERSEGSRVFTTVNDPKDGKSRPVSDIVAVIIK